jgi:hypothetical protein
MSDELFENKDVEATDDNITTILKAIEQSVEPRILEGLLDFLRKLVGKRADKDKFADQIKGKNFFFLTFSFQIFPFFNFLNICDYSFQLVLFISVLAAQQKSTTALSEG